MQQSMDPGLWQRIKPLFEGALDLPAEERAGFIESNTRDEPHLAERLHSMLRAHGEPSSVLDRPLPERFQAIPAGEDEQSGLFGGTCVGGRYRLASELGRGGNGFAWLARDEAVLGRAVVVKVLRGQGAGRSFDAELTALARLNHQSIAAPLDSGVLEDGRRFLVLEYIEGPTLREVLRRGPLEPLRACRLIRQVAAALDAAHAENVWHLDLKPENILVRDAGGQEEQPVLVDFGISRLGGAGGVEGPTGGSLAYASQEQLTGSPTAWSDQYSLARVAVEIITGHRPAVLEPAMTLLGRCGALRHNVIAVLEKALNHRPESRYVSAGTFAAELANALDPRTAVLRRRRLIAAGFCFLLVAVMGTYAWINHQQEHAMLQKEAQITTSQIGIVRTLLETGYLDQRLLAEIARGAVDRLQALADSGERYPDVLDALYYTQMQYGLMHGHPAVPHFGSVEVGISFIEAAMKTLRLMYEDKAEDERYANLTLTSRDALASLLVEAHQYERSTAISRESLRMIDAWETGKTFGGDFAHKRGAILMTLSRDAFHRREWQECLKLRNEGVRLFRLAGERSKEPGFGAEVAGALSARGYLYREMGRLDEAEADYAESDAIMARLESSGVKALTHKWLIARNRLETGKLALLRRIPAHAEPLLEEAVALHRELLEENSHAISIRRTLALSLSWLATSRRALGRKAERWKGLHLEANAVAERALAKDPRNEKAREELALIREQARAAGVELPVARPAPQ